MRNSLFFIFVIISYSLSAQKYMTRNAEVYFLSDKDAFEVVEATNNQVGAVVDLLMGLLPFRFK